MPVRETEVTRRVEEFSNALRAAGFRLTHQRLEVVREVASSDEHPEAEQVFVSVRERVPTISLDTIYRTLGTLVDLGLVDRVVGTAGASRYDANTSGHHHFVCTRCGLIRDIDTGDVRVVDVPSSAEELGTVSSIEVRFAGVCRECANASGT